MVEVLPGSMNFSDQIEHVKRLARRHPQGNPPVSCSWFIACRLAGTLRERLARVSFLFLSIVFAVGVSMLAPPPPPRICGTLHGPSITAPRIRLPDGRPVAYSETGVSKQGASYKVVVVHDYGGSRLDLFPCTAETLERLGVYLVSFDRAGYGESHPFPHRSVASEARDIEHLADALKLGEKFYMIAVGVGAYAAWGCLEHIPHRLAGVAMVAPVANFWWPGIPYSVSVKALQGLGDGERSTLRVAHYAPRLLHSWTSQTWFRSSNLEHLSQSNEISEAGIQQGLGESIHKDLAVQFGSWKIDPKSPHSCSVHIWQGREDPWFPSEYQQWIKETLPWVQHHVVTADKHSLLHINGLPDEILAILVHT